MDRRRLAIACPLAALLLVLLAGCDDKSTSIDWTPSAPNGFQVITGSHGVTLRWDFMDDVTPSLSTSGYKAYIWKDWEPWFEEAVDLEIPLLDLGNMKLPPAVFLGVLLASLGLAIGVLAVALFKMLEFYNRFEL